MGMYLLLYPPKYVKFAKTEIWEIQKIQKISFFVQIFSSALTIRLEIVRVSSILLYAFYSKQTLNYVFSSS